MSLVMTADVEYQAGTLLVILLSEELLSVTVEGRQDGGVSSGEL